MTPAANQATRIALAGGAIILHTTLLHFSMMYRYNRQTMIETWQGIMAQFR